MATENFIGIMTGTSADSLDGCIVSFDKEFQLHESMSIDISENYKSLIENSIKFNNIKIIGLMGMASFTKDELKINNEFKKLKIFFDKIKLKFHHLKILSMGMSSDYKLAMNNGSNMIRIGSQIFGPRN